MSLNKLISQWRGDETSVAFYNLREGVKKMGRPLDGRSIHQTADMTVYAQAPTHFLSSEKPSIHLHVATAGHGTFTLILELDEGINVILKNSFEKEAETFPKLQLPEARKKVEEFLKEFSPGFSEHILGKLSTTPTDVKLDLGERRPCPLHEWQGVEDSKFLLRRQSEFPSDPASYIYDGIEHMPDLPGFEFHKG